MQYTNITDKCIQPLYTIKRNWMTKTSYSMILDIIFYFSFIFMFITFMSNKVCLLKGKIFSWPITIWMFSMTKLRLRTTGVDKCFILIIMHLFCCVDKQMCIKKAGTQRRSLNVLPYTFKFISLVNSWKWRWISAFCIHPQGQHYVSDAMESPLYFNIMFQEIHPHKIFTVSTSDVPHHAVLAMQVKVNGTPLLKRRHFNRSVVAYFKK